MMKANDGWEIWKKWFFTWEQATAEMAEVMLRSPIVLGPSGSMLSAMMRNKARTDEAVAKVWRGVGLPTRGDQERMLHALNQLQSQLYDLEEQLEDIKAQQHQG